MSIKTTIILVAIAILGTSIIYKYYSLTSDISSRDTTILELRASLNETKLRLNTEKGNVVTLNETIRLNNEELKKIAINNAKLKKEFDEWMAKPPKVKYVNKVVNKIITETKYIDGNCSDGLKLNETISNLDYSTIGESL